VCGTSERASERDIDIDTVWVEVEVVRGGELVSCVCVCVRVRACVRASESLGCVWGVCSDRCQIGVCGMYVCMYVCMYMCVSFAVWYFA